MYIAVDETLAVGKHMLAKRARACEEDPVWLVPGRFRMVEAASPAWLDRSETKQLAVLCSALDPVLEQSVAALARSASLRRRLYMPWRGIAAHFKRGGLWDAELAAGIHRALPLWSSDQPQVLAFRTDGFFSGRSYKLFEINVGNWHLWGHEHIAARLRQAPGLGALVADRALPRFSSGLAAYLREELVRRRLPELAVVVVRSDSGGSVEPERFRDALEAVKVHCRVARPHEIGLSGRRLVLSGKAIGLVVDPDEASDAEPLIERWRWRARNLAAFRAGNLLRYPMALGPAVSKSLLALLSAGELDGLIDRDALRVVKERLAWTRLVRAEKTGDPDGRAVDLEDFCAAARADLVLKPAIGMGGVDVHIGEDVGVRDWQRLVLSAVREGGWVVQERLRPSKQRLVLLEPPGEVIDVYIDTNAFSAGGRLIGVWQRFGRSVVTNLCVGESQGRRDLTGVVSTFT